MVRMYNTFEDAGEQWQRTIQATYASLCLLRGRCFHRMRMVSVTMDCTCVCCSDRDQDPLELGGVAGHRHAGDTRRQGRVLARVQKLRPLAARRHGDQAHAAEDLEGACVARRLDGLRREVRSLA